MNFVIARNVDNDTYLICNSNCKEKYVINKAELDRIKNKLCTFDENKIALYSNSKIIRDSITILGKYYSGKEKNIKYIVCNGEVKRASLTKQEIKLKYNSNNFSNARIYSNGSIRMLKGSIPFLNNLSKMQNNDTVVKISNISGATPGSIGVSKKFLGRRVSDDKIGCVKFELFPNSYDIKNEVLAYKLGSLLNFDVAEATFEKFNGNDCIISIYNYDLNTEKIASLKSEIDVDNFNQEFNRGWIERRKSKQAFEKFIQMIILDLIMHQTDRHISNIAFKGNNLYSLYDIFVKSIPEIDLNSREKIVASFHTNEHGYGWMYLEDILMYENYKHLIRHDIEFGEFVNIVNEVYGASDIKRNKWVAEYMYKVYLIITRQERKW